MLGPLSVSVTTLKGRQRIIVRFPLFFKTFYRSTEHGRKSKTVISVFFKIFIQYITLQCLFGFGAEFVPETARYFS